MGLDQSAYVWDPIDGPGQTGVEFTFWRKHNRLQGWMANLWHKKTGLDSYAGINPYGSDFNCERLDLTLEDIDKLEQDINNKNLPLTSGFFFGPDSYNDYEDPDFGNKNRDLRFIEEARHYLLEGKKVYYTSWW